MAEKGSATTAFTPITRASASAAASLTSSASSVPLVLLGRPVSEDGRAGYPELFLELLSRAGCDFIWDKDVEADRSILGRVDAIIAMFHYPKTFYDHPKEEFSNLKIISKLGAGVDRIDVAGWRQRGVVVTNTPEAVADATADLAVALALAVARRLKEALEIARSGDWSGVQLGVDVSGSVVGIVGMGNIGLQIAKRLRAFDAKVIDQEALVTALTNRVIAGAALDVMTPEPLPRDHPLQRLDNCILTPHMGTATEGARRKMVVQAVENLVRGVRGEPLKNVV